MTGREQFPEEPAEWSRVPPDMLTSSDNEPRPLLPLFDGTVIMVPFEQAATEQVHDLSDLIDENGKLLNYGPGV